MSKVHEQLGDWLPIFNKVVDEMGDSYKLLTSTLKAERASKIVYPSSLEVLRAFELTQLKDLKVVIIGQDPYHNGAATGLAFGVRKGYSINPSLRVIYKELCMENEVDEIPDFDFSLESWAKQGVLLLNTTLTVIKGHPNSHENLWKGFVDGMINTVVHDYKDNLVFLLWGKYAQTRFKGMIEHANNTKGTMHVIITSPHPAAEVYGSMKAGFIKGNCFIKANNILNSPIDWVNYYEPESPLPQDTWDGGQIQEL